jgi:hypothetical protein
MDNKLLEWKNNKMKNPYTGKKIKENGPTYKKLKKLYDNYIKNELSPINSIEDKDIISFKTIWTEINGEKKIVYKNLSNLITYKDDMNFIHSFEKESIQYMKEYNIKEHPITKTKIPDWVFKNVNIKIEKKEKTEKELAIDITQILTHNSFFIDHNEFLKLTESDIEKLYFEISAFFNENVPQEDKDIIKNELNIFNINHHQFNVYENKLKYLLNILHKFLEYNNDGIKILACYIIVGGLSLVSMTVKEYYPDFQFNFE